MKDDPMSDNDTTPDPGEKNAATPQTDAAPGAGTAGSGAAADPAEPDAAPEAAVTAGAAQRAGAPAAAPEVSVALDKEAPASADPDTSDVPVADPAGDPASAGRRLPRFAFGRRAKVAAGAAVAVALAATSAGCVALFLQDREHRGLLAAHEEAREAACAYAPVLADYDSKNLDKYFKAVLDGATGDWRKQFESTSTELRQVLEQGEVTTKVTDVQCAIREGNTESAEAIVVVGQSVSSLGTQHKPAAGQLSMVLWLRKSGDRWLVEKLNSPLAQTTPQ